jgi:hypothetical protein
MWGRVRGITAEFFLTTFFSRLPVRVRAVRCGDVPRQPLLDASNGVLGDARKDLAQVRFGIEAIEFRRADQTVEVGGTFPPASSRRTRSSFDLSRPHAKPVPRHYSYTSNRRTCKQFKPAVLCPPNGFIAMTTQTCSATLYTRSC